MVNLIRIYFYSKIDSTSYLHWEAFLMHFNIKEMCFPIYFIVKSFAVYFYSKIISQRVFMQWNYVQYSIQWSRQTNVLVYM